MLEQDDRFRHSRFCLMTALWYRSTCWRAKIKGVTRSDDVAFESNWAADHKLLFILAICTMTSMKSVSPSSRPLTQFYPENPLPDFASPRQETQLPPLEQNGRPTWNVVASLLNSLNISNTIKSLQRGVFGTFSDWHRTSNVTNAWCPSSRKIRRFIGIFPFRSFTLHSRWVSSTISFVSVE